MTFVTKHFPGLGTATVFTDAYGNKRLQLNGDYAPFDYTVPTDKGMAIAQNYLALDKELFSENNRPMPLEAAIAKHNAFRHPRSM